MTVAAGRSSHRQTGRSLRQWAIAVGIGGGGLMVASAATSTAASSSTRIFVGINGVLIIAVLTGTVWIVTRRS